MTTQTKKILSYGRWVGFVAVFVILGYAWSKEPMVDIEPCVPLPPDHLAIGVPSLEDDGSGVAPQKPAFSGDSK